MEITGGVSVLLVVTEHILESEKLRVHLVDPTPTQEETTTLPTRLSVVSQVFMAKTLRFSNDVN